MNASISKEDLDKILLASEGDYGFVVWALNRYFEHGELL